MEEITTVPHSEYDFLDYSEDSELGNALNSFDTDVMLCPNIKDFLLDFVRGNVIFAAFGFQRFIYLNVWVVLVILTALINILVMWILLQKKMRSVTNFLLVAIAMSDSLMGLVKLATAIMVYRKVDSRMPLETLCIYTLSEMLCRAFIISAFFLSKSFHLISIWLTLFLGIQRYMSVAYPFRSRFWFTTRKTAIVVVFICVFAPMVHVYYLVDLNDGIAQGFCALLENDYRFAKMWIVLFLLNIIPCLALAIITFLFIRNLYKNSFQSTNPMHTSSNEDTRSRENHRMSMIVVAIAILSLIPELPQGLLILYFRILLALKMTPSIHIKTHFWISVTYEIALVLSHHLNFYIYTFFNKRFRSYLRETLGTLSSCLNDFCLSTRASSSGDERNIQVTTVNKDLPDTQESTRHGNQVTESVL